MKSLFNKSLVSTGLIIFSFALNRGAATAANLPVHRGATAAQGTHAHAPVHVAARRRAPTAQLNFDVGQFVQAMLGGPLPPSTPRSSATP
jgi:hypothetical protein